MNAVGAAYTMTWNKADQLATAVAFGTTNSYGYDAFGQRLTSKAGTAPTLVQQYGQDGMLLETAGGTGAVVSDYVWLDGTPIAYIKPSTAIVYPLHSDRLGTPQRGTDATQANVWTANYGPFGSVTPTGSITVALRLPGQTAVDASPFYRNGFRDYYPAVPRYLQPDLIGLEGGINTYSYALQNPYKWIDPSGLNPLLGLLARGAIVVAPEAVEALSLSTARVAAILRARTAATAGGAAAAGAGAATVRPPTGAQCTVETPTANLNPYAGPVSESVIAVDPYGNAIPVQPGQYLRSSPNGAYQQVYGSTKSA